MRSRALAARLTLPLGIALLGAAAYSAGVLTAGTPGGAGEWRGPTLGPGTAWRDAGSIFRNHFDTRRAPGDPLESVLLTPYAEECVEDCPLDLRIMSGPLGAAGRWQVLHALGPELEAVLSTPGLPPDLPLAGARALARLRAAPADDAGPGPPMRVLFIRQARPDLGVGAGTLGVAVYDHGDPHFDAARGPMASRGGACLRIVRLERRGEVEAGTGALVGAVEFETVADARGPRIPPERVGALPELFGTLYGHFRGARGGCRGLYLAEDGAVYAYGDDHLPRQPMREERLLRAVRLLLRRV